MEDDATREESKTREIVRILIESKFYFTLSVRERYDLIQYILERFPYYLEDRETTTGHALCYRLEET